MFLKLAAADLSSPVVVVLGVGILFAYAAIVAIMLTGEISYETTANRVNRHVEYVFVSVVAASCGLVLSPWSALPVVAAWLTSRKAGQARARRELSAC